MNQELSTVGGGAGPGVRPAQRTLGVHSQHFDPLLGCLEIAADHYGRSMSAAALISGLPLVDGRLTPQLALRAASRVGLSARIVKRRIDELLKILFPVILLMDGNNSIVLLDHDGETATIALPETGKGTVKMPLPSLADSYSGYAILIKPEYRSPQEQENTQRPKATGCGVRSRRCGPLTSRSFSPPR